MKISELISSLELALDKHGNVNVKSRNWSHGSFALDGVEVRMGDAKATRGYLLIEGSRYDKKFEQTEP